MPVSSAVSSVGTAFPWKSGGVMACIFYYIFLYAILLYLVPDCCRMYVVPVASSSVYVVHIRAFFPMKVRWVVRMNERTEGNIVRT